MKYLYVFISLLFISLSSSAQSNYKPGYVVDLKNDTLKGFIGYKEWENNPKSFTFKSNLNQSRPQKFSVDDANAFGISGAEHFQKFIFSKTTAPDDFDKILVHLDTSRVLDTSFMKIVIKGKNVSLYSFKDLIKTRFYILNNKKHQPEELDYYNYYAKDNENKYQTLYIFRAQLQDLADIYNVKGAELAGKIKYAKYKESDIKDIVAFINGGISSQNLESNNVFGFRIFAGAAARFNKLVLRGGSTFFPDGTGTDVSSPVVSAGIDFFINKHTQKVVFRTEVELSSAHYTVPLTEINGNGTKASIDFKQLNISFVPQLIYNVYSKDKFKVFINGGIAFNFSSYNQYYYLLNFNNISTSRRPNYPGFSRYYNEGRVKAGFMIGGEIEIYGSHSFLAPLNGNEGSSASVSFYQAGINYLF